MAQDETVIAPPAPEETAPAASPRAEEYVPILPGDTLEDIAARYGTDVQTIVDRNHLNPDWFLPNQWIFV